MTEHQKIHVGQDYASVIAMLGEPDDRNNGGNLLSAARAVLMGRGSETASRLFHTDFCIWRRPEGEYRLMFEFGKLAKISNAPEGAVKEESAAPLRKHRLARIALIVFAEQPDDPRRTCDRVLANLAIEVLGDGIGTWLVDQQTAIDSTFESALAFLYGRVLGLCEEEGMERERLDMEKCELLHFRALGGEEQWNAGVILVVPPRTVSSMAPLAGFQPLQLIEQCLKHHYAAWAHTPSGKWAQWLTHRVLGESGERLAQLAVEAMQVALPYDTGESRSIVSGDCCIEVRAFGCALDEARQIFFKEGYLPYLNTAWRAARERQPKSHLMEFLFFWDGTEFWVHFTLVPNKDAVSIQTLSVLPIELLSADEKRKLNF